MIAIKTADLTQNFKEIADLIVSGERVLISRPQNKNLVVITEKEYNELDRLRKNAQYLTKLKNSIRQAQEGKTVTYTKTQMRDMETG
jgi:antitoxin YefM